MNPKRKVRGFAAYDTDREAAIFYDTRIIGSHGFPHDPFKALVSPRPIGWITTNDSTGAVNLAPFSFFNAVSFNPCVVIFAASGLIDDPKKNSWRNAEEEGEFVCNIVSENLMEQMLTTALHVPRGVDELEMAGLTAEPSQMVRPPRVKEAPAHLECRFMKTVVIESPHAHQTTGVVFGEVIGIHIRDEFILDGIVDVLAYRPVARMGYMDYTTVKQSFKMKLRDTKTKPSSDS